MDADSRSLTDTAVVCIGRHNVDVGDLILKLLPVANRLTHGHRYDAENLVHDTLERLLARGSTYEDVSNPVAFARKILARIFLDSVRSAARKHETAMSDDQDESGPDTLSWQVAVRLDIEAAMAQLTPAAALVTTHLIDREEGDFRARSHAEVAHILGIEISTVASTLRDARQQLRKLLPPDYFEDIA